MPNKIYEEPIGRTTKGGKGSFSPRGTKDKQNKTHSPITCLPHINLFLREVTRNWLLFLCKGGARHPLQNERADLKCFLPPSLVFVQLHAKGSLAAPKWHHDACSHKNQPAISSRLRHESSCREEGYSGLQEVASPALPWVFPTIPAKTHSPRVACRGSWVLASSGCLRGDTPTPMLSSTHRPGAHSRIALGLSGGPPGPFPPTLSLSVCILSLASWLESYRLRWVHGAHLFSKPLRTWKFSKIKNLLSLSLSDW